MSEDRLLRDLDNWHGSYDQLAQAAARRIREAESKLEAREKDHEALVNMLARRCEEIQGLESRLDECRESCARAVAARDVATSRLDSEAGRVEAACVERDEARAHRIELENILDAIRKVIEHGAVSPSLDVRSDAACAVLDMLRQLDREGAVETCHHEWIDIRNMAVESGEMCSKCRALRPGNATDVENQERKGLIELGWFEGLPPKSE